VSDLDLDEELDQEETLTRYERGKESAKSWIASIALASLWALLAFIAFKVIFFFFALIILGTIVAADFYAVVAPIRGGDWVLIIFLLAAFLGR
jgi:hypothetical protein